MPAYKDVDTKTNETRWRYRFAYNGQRYSGSAPLGNNTKRAAERLEKQHHEKLIANRYTGTMPTVKEFGARMLEHQKPRTAPLTYAQQSATINRHVIPAWGPSKIDRVTKEMIDQLVTMWSATCAPKTINTRLATVRRMFSLAVEWEILPSVPRIDFVTVPDVTPRWLTDEECYALISKTESQWTAMVIVALRTGLRIGELRGLQWGDVDFARRVIQVRRTDPGRRTMDAKSPKGKRERTVPLSNDAIAALESVRLVKAKASDWVWPALLKRQGETRSRARSEKGCWHAIDRAARAAGLEDVGWHTLRHTYASHLVMRGVPIRTVQSWLGHASIVETEKYSHLAPSHGHEAANLLDAPITPESTRQHATNRLPAGSRERNKTARLPSKG